MTPAQKLWPHGSLQPLTPCASAHRHSDTGTCTETPTALSVPHPGIQVHTGLGLTENCLEAKPEWAPPAQPRPPPCQHTVKGGDKAPEPRGVHMWGYRASQVGPRPWWLILPASSWYRTREQTGASTRDPNLEAQHEAPPGEVSLLGSAHAGSPH